MDAVSQLRLSILPIFQAWEQELRAEHPDFIIKIWDGPVGKLTDWQGHDIGIECMFTNAAPGSSDNIALTVNLKHLNHPMPLIESADVVWGHPSGCVEASLLTAPVEFSPERLAEVVGRLPDLFAALKQAVRRGRPQ